MTYTMVYRDYLAETFAEAASAMLQDVEVWGPPEPPTETMLEARLGGDYQLARWEWLDPTPEVPQTHLRAWFR